VDVYSWHDGVYDSKEEEKHHNLTARPNTFKPATADPGNFTIWLVLWSQPISFNRRLVRCFNFITPLWSAVDYYQHLSIRQKAWNTPSLGTDWNQRFDQKQQWMSVTFMAWQSVWQQGQGKASQFNGGPTKPNQPLQNPAMPPSDLFYNVNQFHSTGD
jgi:hypothetical protein